MENSFEELLRQYEALWENDAPKEQIVDFCRQHLDEDEKRLFYVLVTSAKWGKMVFMPSFLKHLRDDDDSLLRGLASYLRSIRGLDYYVLFVVVSRILSMKNILSDKVRAAFWTEQKKVGWRYSGLVREGCEDMTLVDNEGILRTILKRRKKGYDLIPHGLFFLDGKRFFIRMPEKMRQALLLDSVSMFEMALILTGKNITIGLLREILCASAYNILIHLMKNCPKSLTDILSPHDLLICICAYPFTVPIEKVINVLDVLEELNPGISKRTDKLGNNPLWYCLYYRSPEDSLVQALIRYGCDPDQRNHLNLSWRICADVQNLI